ncbi:MAG: D-2-hydroxyacid dehydrogenase [Mailhella sp.]|nr:D-2-hydroxyacid dehydrogenase [Mailhella sp.]
MLAQTFALIRRFGQYGRNQIRHEWKPMGAVTSVEGSVTAVLGLGDIGGDYARKVKALGAYVIGLRKNVREKLPYLDEQYTVDELDAVLPRADIVAMVLPGSAETTHIMDEKRLRKMKPGAYLLNSGRGTAVDLSALKTLLREGRIGGAALDVTEPEPLPDDDELWDLDNVIITPHVAGQLLLPETLNRIIRIASENLGHWIKGEPLRNVVPH